MVEWEVLDEEPLPGEEDVAPPRRRAWLPLLLGLGLLVTLGLGTVQARVRQNEARRHADILGTVQAEEQALRAGAVTQVGTLTDPRAPRDWQLRYEALFAHFPTNYPPVTVQAVEVEGDLARVTLAFPDGTWPPQEARAYRLVGDTWRRTPFPADRWAAPQRHDSPHFRLWLNEQDASALPPDEWLTFLETFRAQFAPLWPVQEGPLTIRVVPEDLGQLALRPDLSAPRTLFLPSPLIVGPTKFEAEGGSLRLKLALAVAGILDATPPRVPLDEDAHHLLRAALVRHLVLSPSEQQAYRARARTLSDWRVWGIPQTTFIFLSDLLLAAEGPDAPARLVRALSQSTGLEAATVQAFGTPLPTLLQQVQLWQAAEENASQEATLLRILAEEPLRLLVVQGEELQELRAPLLESALPLPCLGAGSRLRWDALTPQGQAEHLRVIEPRLPPPPLAAPSRAGGALLIQRARATTRALGVVYDEGTESLGVLPHDIQPVTDTAGGGFAYMRRDRCGTSVVQWDGHTGAASRLPVPLTPDSHLVWLDGSLYLLQDNATDPQAAHWLLTHLEPERVGETRRVPVTAGQGWGALMGAHGHRFLVQVRDGSLAWLYLASSLALPDSALQPANLSLPAGATLVADQDGWLFYSAPIADGVGLFLREGPVERTRVIHVAPPGAQYHDVVVSAEESPTAYASLSQVEDGPANSILVLLPSTLSNVDPGSLYPLNGPARDLHLCADGRLFYTVERDGEPLLMEGIGIPQPLPDQEFLACLDPPRTD